MPRFSSPLVRWAILFALLALASVLLAGEGAVPPYWLAVMLPVSMAYVVWLKHALRKEIRQEIGEQIPEDGRYEEILRQNELLTRELRESRVIFEHAELQGKAFDAFLQGVVITDPNRLGNPVVYVNEGFTRLTGYTVREVIGKDCSFLQGPETSPESVERIRLALSRVEPCTVEILNYRKDGTPFWNALTMTPILDEGLLTHFVWVQFDITSFKQMELQLRQSQKMEAIGHLAGGIAHDFNNILTVINGCCELLRAGKNLPAESAELVEEIHRAGDRAATLTRQLLAFSRKTVLQPRVHSLNELVRDFRKLLGRLIGEHIELEADLRADPGYVRVDVSQMEQVLMNLVVNARDAMPRGGKITIATRDLYLDEEYVRTIPDLVSGRYVLLTVTDTGCGMDRATLSRIFEPFFTTKGVGKGTGLGLAMVYGIIKASGGHACVESELGRGTTFSLYLPETEHPDGVFIAPSRVCQSSGTETVLLVEDEDGIRSLARQALESRGYQVLEANNGQEALEICQNLGDSINLILSDVVMPRMGGRELRDSVARISPHTRVIFTSGHAEDAMNLPGWSPSDEDFIQKPFTMNTLLRKVREALDRVPVLQLESRA